MLLLPLGWEALAGNIPIFLSAHLRLTYYEPFFIPPGSERDFLMAAAVFQIRLYFSPFLTSFLLRHSGDEIPTLPPVLNS